MLLRNVDTKSAWVWIQGFWIFAWLTELSVLVGTDTYYSVYLLCGILAIMALCKNATSQREISVKQRCILSISAGIFSLAIGGGG